MCPLILFMEKWVKPLLCCCLGSADQGIYFGPTAVKKQSEKLRMTQYGFAEAQRWTFVVLLEAYETCELECLLTYDQPEGA